MSVQEIALTGNYQTLRNLYLIFRGLVREKKISLAYVSKEDTEYIRGNITFNPEYTPEQAIFIYNFLKRFVNDFVLNGISFASVPPPDSSLKQTVTAEATQKYIAFSNDKFIIRFPYSTEIYKKVKLLPGREYDADKKCWTMPLVQSEHVKRFAEQHGFTIGESAQRVIYGVEENLEKSYSAERIELNIPLKKDLFDYQTVGVDFQLRVKRCLNADEMGLGKTPQGIAYMVGLNKWPVLVVCPKSLKYNWQNEIVDWSDRKVLVANDKIMKYIHNYIETGLCEILVINYDGLKKHFCSSVEENGRGIKVTLNKNIALFKAVIYDEAHKIRNEKTQLYKVAKKVMHSIEDRLLLTGTPIVNKINDMASMLDLLGRLDPEFDGRWKFNEKYGSVTKDSFDGEKRQRTNLEQEGLLKELNIKLRSTCMIRREKHQVAKDLPDKIRTKHEVELSNRAEYDHAYLNLQDFLAKNGASEEKISASLRAELLVQFTYLKKLSAIGKIPDFVEFVEELFANGKKYVLFAWHKDILQQVKKHFPDMMIVDGDVKDITINDHVVKFQNDPKARIIGLTYKRGAEGLTLTAAHHWGCLEFPWTDAILDQAESRIHRHTQTHTSYCGYFVGKDTVDQHIYSIIERKRNISKHATGTTGEIAEITEDQLVKMLIKTLKTDTEKVLT